MYHYKMKLFNFFCAAFFFLGLIFLPISGHLEAHGDRFHSLSDLSDHIQHHLSRLESLRQDDGISQECKAIFQHAEQYKKFASFYLTQNQKSETAKKIHSLTSQLSERAQKSDLNGSITILRQIRSLLA